MAEDETESDIETEGTEGTDEEGAGSGSKMKVIAILLAVLAIGGYFAAPYVMNIISPPTVTDNETVAEEESSKPALFASLHPPLVVNFKDSFGDAHFMQVTLEVMARDQGIIDEVKNYTAMIRNSLILMYGSVDYDVVTTREGKETMLANALDEIQKIIERETGETGVEAVFFTALIIQ